MTTQEKIYKVTSHVLEGTEVEVQAPEVSGWRAVSFAPSLEPSMVRILWECDAPAGADTLLDGYA